MGKRRRTKVMDVLLLLFLVVCAIASVSMKDLLSVTIMLGAYSLIMAVVWTRLNAVDVAFTEASVGAGITAILMIAALSRTRRMEEEKEARKGYGFRRPLLFLAVVGTSAALIYGTMDMPDFEDPGAPQQIHVAPRYIEKSYEESGVPNMVTAVLANYRGYDTLGETTVIFTAGIGVVLLIRRKRGWRT